MENKDNAEMASEDIFADLTKAEKELPKHQILAGVSLKTSKRKSTGIAAVDEEISKVDNAVLGSRVSLGGTLESTKLKTKMFSKKPEKDMKEKLPAHIRKAYIVINDKKPNDPIAISFSGVWTGSDINLAGKHLILDYQVYVRNRAIKE